MLIFLLLEKIHPIDKETLEELFMKECLQSRGVPTNSDPRISQKTNTDNFRNFPYFNQVSQLSLGQMTVYRLQLECSCGILKKDEKCVSFSKPNLQRWPSYLGRLGNGFFNIPN